MIRVSVRVRIRIAVVLSDFTFTVYEVGSGELTQTSLSAPSSWSVAILESVDVRL